ncbi:MAG TPA: PIN domain-containing protein [Urbifossiella sp.]|jgi:PIN domain nuclease of toxin-antitoxin system|nr:PIN domain-containing protein [Urbifossiella sp.]
MKPVAADTHAAIWFLENDRRLTAAAAGALDKAERILLPSICLVEITYLVEKGRLEEAVLPRLYAELDNPSTTLFLAPLDLGVVLALQRISRLDVPDLPDRVIAATARHYCVPPVTRDRVIRASGVETIW